MADPTTYYVRDLFDAARCHNGVKLTCNRCKHVTIYPSAALWWLFYRHGWADRFRDVQRRCFCIMCYHKQGIKVRYPKLELVEDPPTDQSLAMPSELDWKRESRRRR